MCTTSACSSSLCLHTLLSLGSPLTWICPPCGHCCATSSYQQRSTGSSRTSGRRSSRIPVDPAAKITRDAIKREEAFMLNAWSSNMFQGAGVAVAIIVLLAVVVTAGPPPADSRCTLPWC